MTATVKTPSKRNSTKKTHEEVIPSVSQEAVKAEAPVSVAPATLPPGFYRTTSGFLAWGG